MPRNAPLGAGAADPPPALPHHPPTYLTQWLCTSVMCSLFRPLPLQATAVAFFPAVPFHSYAPPIHPGWPLPHCPSLLLPRASAAYYTEGCEASQAAGWRQEAPGKRAGGWLVRMAGRRGQTDIQAVHPKGTACRRGGWVEGNANLCMVRRLSRFAGGGYWEQGGQEGRVRGCDGGLVRGGW